MEKKVGELSVSEFREIIRETFFELLDPEYHLPFREEFESLISKAIEEKKKGEGLTLEEVKKILKIE